MDESYFYRSGAPDANPRLPMNLRSELPDGLRSFGGRMCRMPIERLGGSLLITPLSQLGTCNHTFNQLAIMFNQ